MTSGVEAALRASLLFRRLSPEDRRRLAELADLTGTTIETAIRIMSRWGRQHLVSTGRDGFVLHDRGALELLAGER